MSKKSRKRSGNGQQSYKGSKQERKKSSRSSKLPIIIIALVIIGVGGYLLYAKSSQKEVPVVVHSESPEDIQKTIETLKGHETRMTLMPALFTGKVAQAYQIARQYRDLLDVIYCYCYCERNLGHKSLLTCYVDRHAANCDICMDQAIFAANLYKKGFDMVQVRQAVDKKFWKPLR